MKANDLKTAERFLGFKPNRALMLLLLKAVKDEAITIEEACSRYALPPMFTPGANGTFDYHGQKMTAEQFKETYPHKKFITIKCDNK